MNERIIDPDPQPEEIPAEISLRPQTLDEYVGQDELKRNLRVFIQAAKARSDALATNLMFCAKHSRRNREVFSALSPSMFTT